VNRMSDIERAKIIARTLAGRGLLVRTKSCVLYFAKVKQWLMTGNLGAIVYGRPRLGKTSATRWVIRVLPEKFGNIPFIEVPIRKQHLQNEGAFFQFLLKCCRAKYFNKGSVADKRDRFGEALLMRARRSSTRTVIVFIDEAQTLEVLQYEWLQNISNELDAIGYRVFFLLVGQHELDERRKTLILEGHEQIVARFMTEALSFSGLTSVEQLKDALRGYDEGMFPEPKGKIVQDSKAFLAWFIPKAFGRGFRLENEGARLWSGYQNVWIELGIDDVLELPMHYVTSTVTNLLSLLSEIDSDNLIVDDKLIVNSIKASGFKNSVAILMEGRKKIK